MAVVRGVFVKLLMPSRFSTSRTKNWPLRLCTVAETPASLSESSTGGSGTSPSGVTARATASGGCCNHTCCHESIGTHQHKCCHGRVARANCASPGNRQRFVGTWSTPLLCLIVHWSVELSSLCRCLAGSGQKAARPLLPGLPPAGLVAAAEHVVVDRTRQYLLVKSACGMLLTPPCTSLPNLRGVCKLLMCAVEPKRHGSHAKISGTKPAQGCAPSFRAGGAPSRLNLFRFVKWSDCDLLRAKDVHRGSSRSNPTASH